MPARCEIPKATNVAAIFNRDQPISAQQQMRRLPGRRGPRRATRLRHRGALGQESVEACPRRTRQSRFSRDRSAWPYGGKAPSSPTRRIRAFAGPRLNTPANKLAGISRLRRSYRDPVAVDRAMREIWRYAPDMPLRGKKSRFARAALVEPRVTGVVLWGGSPSAMPTNVVIVAKRSVAAAAGCSC